MKRHLLACALALSCAGPAAAIDWQPNAELGIVATTGNSDTVSVNGKLAAKGEDEAWLHDYYALFLRSRQEDDDTAERYEVGGKSGFKLTDRRYVYGALRYEDDQFSAYEYQATLSGGYGWHAIKTDPTTLLFEIGPGYRNAEPAGPNDTENSVIVRAFGDFHHKFNENTEFFNTLLIESSSDNTFAQNDIGVSVKVSRSLALKAALQARHNSEVDPGTDKTDTLTTLNLVWSPDKVK
jgi:putative salt-induced outer membrane protein